MNELQMLQAELWFTAITRLILIVFLVFIIVYDFTSGVHPATYIGSLVFFWTMLIACVLQEREVIARLRYLTSQ